MRIWLACFIVLFALAELFDWVKDFSLPLPIYILGGAFLAIASNYHKLISIYNPTTGDIGTEIISEIHTEHAQQNIQPSTTTPISLPTSQTSQELQPTETIE